MGVEKDKLKREIESALVFALNKDPKPELIEGLLHWQDVVNFVISRKIAGRFYKRLKENHLLHLVPDPWLNNVKEFYYFNALKNKILFKDLERIATHFKAHQVNLILLKGASLLVRGVYQQGERFQADLDFLVSGISREQLQKEILELGYLNVHHSDAQDWSEESFVSKGSKGLADISAVFLEFHWTFRPINHHSGEKLAQAILKGAEPIAFNSCVFNVPKPELQFYQAGLHGCAHHPFDSGYFWVALQDLSAIADRLKLDSDEIINIALEHRLAEHLGVLAFLLKEKLGIFPQLWEGLASRIPESKTLVEQTARVVWDGLLNPRPVSLSHFIYLFSPTDPRNRRKAILELTGLRRTGEKVQAGETNLQNPRPGFFALLSYRIRTLDWQFLKMVWQIAKFHRKVKVYFPWGT